MPVQHQVLIVEDDELLQKHFAQVLVQCNFKVATAGSLAEAKELIEQIETLDAVLLDNQLTDGYGLALIPLIKQLFADCSILMVSVNLDGNFFVEAFAVGIDDYLTKPVNVDLLRFKLDKIINDKKLIRFSEGQSQELAMRIDLEQHEQELARHVFESLCNQVTEPSGFLKVCSKASAAFSGDLLLHQFGLDGSLYILLADSMGHGLAAAMALLPVLETFQAMSRKGLPLMHLVYELNEKLLHRLPEDRFVAAVLLRVNSAFDNVEIWNGGMPPVLIFDGQYSLAAVAKSTHMALGILSNNQLDLTTQKFQLNSGMQLVGYTDGLFDNISQDGLQLDEKQLREIWCSQQGFLRIHQFMQSVTSPKDDMMVFVLDLARLQAIEAVTKPAVWREGRCGLKFELAGHALMQLDISQQVIHVLQKCDMPQALCNKTFSVLTELFLNAFEHGVLGLNSAIKQQDDGFLLYYDEKQQKSAHLTNDDFVCFSVQWHYATNAVEIWMRDSGAGFNWTGGNDTQSDATAGRGLAMIQSLCATVDYVGNGNEVTVVING